MSRQPRNVAWAVWTGWIVALLIGLSAQPAGAEDSRWYLKAWSGQADIDLHLNEGRVNYVVDDGGAMSLEVGYQLHKFVAIQVGYHDFGEHMGYGSPCPDPADACIERLATELGTTPSEIALCAEGRDCLFPEILVPVSGDLDALSVSVVPRWPVTEHFSIYGKVGILDWDFQLSGGGLSYQDSSESKLLTGVGLEYLFTKGLTLGLEYQRTDSDVEAASLGLGWRF